MELKEKEIIKDEEVKVMEIIKEEDMVEEIYEEEV